jgi:hypothetical protein
MTKPVDFTKPVMLRNEMPFTLMGTNFRGPCPVQGYAGDSKNLVERYPDGRCYCDGTYSPFDIVNVPEKIVGYMNIYRHSIGSFNISRKEADLIAHTDRLACICIEYTEGQFDD